MLYHLIPAPFPPQQGDDFHATSFHFLHYYRQQNYSSTNMTWNFETFFGWVGITPNHILLRIYDKFQWENVKTC